MQRERVDRERYTEDPLYLPARRGVAVYIEIERGYGEREGG